VTEKALSTAGGEQTAGGLRYVFENYVLDTDRRELHCGSVPVSIAPQVFDLLDYLIRNRHRVVSKDDLINAIWNGRIVSDAALTTRLNVARSAVGDSGDEQRLIKTLPRKGFRFIGQVQEASRRADAIEVDHRAQTSNPVLTLPDKPSLAVLPFQNLGGNLEQDYFADGMVEDIISGLSRSKSLFVISRSSSFTYKGKVIDIKQIGRELGVRYVLEGSVRNAGNRVRIAAQLIDAASGVNVWADRFEDHLEDIFDLQDHLTGSVTGAISPQLDRAEMERAQRKPTENLQAYDYYLRAMFATYQYTRQSNLETLKLTKIAIALDPSFARAYAFAANSFGAKKAWWMADTVQDRAETRQLVERAIQLDNDDPLVLAWSGQAYSYVLDEPETGAALLARAVAIDPNLAIARNWKGWAHVYLGNTDAAIEQFSAAIRLSPLDPRAFLSQAGMGYAHFFAGRYEEGISWAMNAIQGRASFPGAQRALMVNLAMAGRIADARRACDAALQTDPALRISGIRNRTPLRRLEDVEKLGRAYRMAGVPE
jgi:TolB-like protein